MKRAPLSPDEATQRDQVRRFLDLLTGTAAVSAALSAVQATPTGSARSWAFAIVLGGYAALMILWPRRILARGGVETAVTVMALASAAVICVTAIIEPSSAFIASTALLIPMTAAVPYLEVRSLRLLMIAAWAATIATAAASLLPDAQARASGAADVGRLWGPIVVNGLVLFLIYQSSERLKASSREFRPLFSLSSDLAEASDPSVLGDLVAHHLTEATGMDDCVIYARAAETGRLSPFGSYPPARSMSTDADALMMRPMLQRVIDERTHMFVDVVNEHADPPAPVSLRSGPVA